MSSLVPEEAVQSEAIVFLHKELDVEARIELERVLGEMEEIEITFVPKVIALQELSAQDGLRPIADLQDNNPLPDTPPPGFRLGPQNNRK